MPVLAGLASLPCLGVSSTSSQAWLDHFPLSSLTALGAFHPCAELFPAGGGKSVGWGFTLLTWARSQLLPFWVALAWAPIPESHSWSVKQRYAHVGWAVGSPVASEGRSTGSQA